MSGTEPDAISCNFKTLQIPPLTGRFEGALNLSHNSIFNEQWAFPPKILTGVFALAFFRFRGKKVREPILDPSNSAAQTIVYCTGKLFWLCAAVNAYYASQRSSFKRTLRRISQPRADASIFFTFFSSLPSRGAEFQKQRRQNLHLSQCFQWVRGLPSIKRAGKLHSARHSKLSRR